MNCKSKKSSRKIVLHICSNLECPQCSIILQEHRGQLPLRYLRIWVPLWLRDDCSIDPIVTDGQIVTFKFKLWVSAKSQAALSALVLAKQYQSCTRFFPIKCMKEFNKKRG